jgi:hypothetical protein
MRFAYADPPYIGQAKKHYENELDYAGEIDHRELIERLDRDYDGWALSASSPSLREVLPMCPEGVRVEAWVKPFAAYKRNIRVAYAWEPVIVRELPRREGLLLAVQRRRPLARGRVRRSLPRHGRRLGGMGEVVRARWPEAATDHQGPERAPADQRGREGIAQASGCTPMLSIHDLWPDA